ncbi:hypothetical protein FDP41_002127 [Naegleria fowleri]|uniref:Protein kinase domain-containing protein n=1 Tax=Naegleria fowleri TaxID=5763 RepID=A0A6A5BPN8_NAEFO|nr:uncharacterized protein FDP41_002127 [Naegleria fowleri]KAF0979057.1 hypothetical protein FDP41_002127 [Naegleria fowleri]
MLPQQSHHHAYPQHQQSNYNLAPSYYHHAGSDQAMMMNPQQEQQQQIKDQMMNQQFLEQQQNYMMDQQEDYATQQQLFMQAQQVNREQVPFANLQMEYVQYSVNGNTFSLPKRYTMDGVKGSGGFGCVVSAVDNKNNERVAIKKVSSLWERDRNYQKRILREIKILKHFSIHHAHNVVILKDLFFDPYQPGSIYIVTNLMDFDLEKLLSSNQTFSEQSIQYFLHEILKAVNIMHSSNIIHRDLKGMYFILESQIYSFLDNINIPSNILLNRDLDLQICDFGLSRAIGQDYPEDSKYVVTRWYRSPEVILYWNKLHAAMDMWSIGCIFAELLVKPLHKNGRPILFPGKDFKDQLELILRLIGTPSNEEVRGCSEGIKFLRTSFKQHYEKKNFSQVFSHVTNPLAIDLLERMLTWDPEKRITVQDALKHPYLKEMFDPDEFNLDPSCNENSYFCKARFDYQFSEDIKTEDIKVLVEAEVESFQQYIMQQQHQTHMMDDHH